jgi:ubiquinone/menaquinone biosynthesis C-methylase UbiE
MPDFDSVARVYRVLEHAAFGRTLQRARVAHIDRLCHCTDILIVGDGDGRFLSALMTAAPTARVHCIDASPAMQAIAAARLCAADRARVTFECADVRTVDLGARTFDAIVTMFFLDCFVDAEVEAIVTSLSPRLRTGGTWLFVDFAIPPRGVAQWHARVIVGALYAFFRWQAGITARLLPASEMILQRAGFARVAEQEFRAGVVRSVVYLSGHSTIS